MMEQAQELFDSGRYAEAERLYRAALRQDQANTRAVFMLALVRQQRGAPEEALELMEQAARQDPDNPNIHFTLGSMQAASRRIDEARRSYLQAIQLDPFNVDAHNGLAFTELAAGNWSAAENAANMSLAEDANNIQALVYLGTAKLEQGDTTKAISYFQEVLKQAPGHQSARLLLGRAFLEAGNHAFAAQVFQTILEKDSSVAQAWEFLGRACSEQGQHAEAAAAYRAALATGTSKPSLVRAMAEAHRANGEADLAEEILKAAADPDRDTSAVDFLRATAYVSQGKPQLALKALEPYGGYQADMLRASALEQLRDFEGVLALVEPWLDSGEATDDMRLSYARVLAKLGRNEESDAILDSFMALEEPPLSARVFRGFQLCRSGDERGIELLREVETLDELEEAERRRVRRILAQTLDQLGRYDEAAEYYARNSGRLAQATVVARTANLDNREMLDEQGMPLFQRRQADGELPTDPVFLLTWPGSGWEWLMSGLNAHPGVMAVVDKPESQIRRRELLAKPEGREDLRVFTPRDATDAARQYWQFLASGQLAPGPRQTVDALWIAADMLPTLSAVFPAARVLVVHRDPAEQVLEWLRAGYAELPDMAEAMRDQNALVQAYREKVPLAFIDVDGDRLVADPEPVLREVLGQLELDWHEQVGRQVNELRRSQHAYRGKAADYQDALEAPFGILGAAV